MTRIWSVPGTTVPVPPSAGRHRMAKVARSCGGNVGSAWCADHRSAGGFANGAELHGHTSEPGTHRIYWWCDSHGQPEAIRE